MSYQNEAVRSLRGVTVAPGTAAHAAIALRLSGTPLRLVAFGMTMLMVGAVLLVIWGGDLAGAGTLGSWHALALVHIFALGFATSLIMAVLYQFVPASFHANVRGIRRATWMSILYIASVTLFVISFATGAVVIAAIAGPLLAIAVAIFLSQMWSVVFRAKRRTIEGGFHISAFAFLSLVIVLGALLATSLPNAWLGNPERLLGVKVICAVAGWLGCILMGVSYHTVRGLNGATRRPRYVGPALVFALAGITSAVVLVVLSAAMIDLSLALALIAIGTVLFSVDVLRMVRSRAAGARAVTWAGQLTMCLLLVASACEGAAAPLEGMQWLAAAIAGVLTAVVPMGIVANGNRIVPVLIANRYSGRGRDPLNAGAPGRLAMPLAEAAVVAGWVVSQWGILSGTGWAVRTAGGLLTVAALSLAGTVVWRLRAARAQAGQPRFELREGGSVRRAS